MPEFTKSVTFADPARELSMRKLEGKLVVVLFFQSWCPKCNDWSPDLFKQVQGAAGGRRDVVLIGLKTDGGGVKGAEQYLEECGVNLGRWFVGADKDAEYYRKVTGDNKLYYHTIVWPGGQIAETKQGGATYNMGGRKVFVTARHLKDRLKKAKGLKTVLPKGVHVPPELRDSARLAEVGELGAAIKLAMSGRLRTSRDEKIVAFKKVLADVGAKRISAAQAAVLDESRDWGARYESYKKLAALADELKALPAAREARSVLSKMRGSPELRRESAVETHYNRIVAKLEKASDRSRPRVAKELEALSKRYEGTRYGKLAAQKAKSIAGE